MEKQLGKEQSVEVDFKEGKLVVILKQEGHDGGVEVKGYVSTDRLLDKLAAKIPGTIDDAAIGLVKAALKNI